MLLSAIFSYMCDKVSEPSSWRQYCDVFTFRYFALA